MRETTFIFTTSVVESFHVWCGIAGPFKPHRQTTPDDISAARCIMAVHIHQGPDADGLYYDARVVLGHRRLAIIDLSAASQLLSNADGTVWVSYHGNIYNNCELRNGIIVRGHLFTSQSGTEVIVHGYVFWGIEVLLPRLRGMFVYDLRQ